MTRCTRDRERLLATTRVAASLCVALIGCTPPKAPVLPGATDIAITSVVIEPRAGEALDADVRELPSKLALQAPHTFNGFRVAEDRVRIAAFLQDLGYFDAEVDDAELAHADRGHVAITWRVHEGPRYAVGSVAIVGAPAGYEPVLAALVPFHAGDPVDLTAYRPVRNAMADRLRDDGYGRAQAYSRTFVDHEAKQVAWFYFVEPGPPTRVGTITIEGNHRVPAGSILALAGLARGDRYDKSARRRAQLALLDSGAFASAAVFSDADDIGPPVYPDNGGVLAPDQIDASGNFTPRTLGSDLDVHVAVVEAPARQLRAELGVEADPSRVDAFVGARLWLRDLFAPLHHLVLEGNVGYGWFVDGDDPVRGVYGSALVQYQHPGFLASALELRFTGRWRDTLYPSALLREVTAGPGLRATLAPGMFVEGEVRFRYGAQIGLPAIDRTSALALPSGDTSRGAEAAASFIVDRRNDRVEPTDGWLASIQASFAPGGALGDHRWLQLIGDARGFVPIGTDWSVGARATAGVVTLDDGSGIPLGPRLFGGGVDGMRGFARDHLSPRACRASAMMMTTSCDVLVGGRSLAESSVELRWLPAHKFYGATGFVDAGAAGAARDPFASGVSLALGGGVRLRTWYLPVSFDVAYRVLDENRAGLAWDRVVGFFHIGEAF